VFPPSIMTGSITAAAVAAARAERSAGGMKDPVQHLVGRQRWAAKSQSIALCHRSAG
jgi:hypothetical protein